MPNFKSGYSRLSEIKRENFRDDCEYVIALFEYALELQDKMDANEISYPYEFNVQATKRDKIKRENFRTLDEYYNTVAPLIKKEITILEKFLKQAGVKPNVKNKKPLKWDERPAPLQSLLRGLSQVLKKKDLEYPQCPVTKLPAITRLASYTEILEIAFNPESNDSEAAKAKDALTRAQKKGGDINRFQFIIPFYPNKGKIKFIQKIVK